MIKEFITSLFADYERLIVSKIVLIVLLLGGLLMSILILAILLLLKYPAFVWCIFGGFVAIWILGLLIAYGYCRIAKAEHKAHMKQAESIESIVKCVSLAVVNVVNAVTDKKENKKE